MFLKGFTIRRWFLCKLDISDVFLKFELATPAGHVLFQTKDTYRHQTGSFNFDNSNTRQTLTGSLIYNKNKSVNKINGSAIGPVRN